MGLPLLNHQRAQTIVAAKKQTADCQCKPVKKEEVMFADFSFSNRILATGKNYEYLSFMAFG